MKYKQKPIIVEAVHYKGETVVLTSWIQEAFKNHTMYYDEDDLYIETPFGERLVNVGDYIVRGVSGGIFPCREDFFEACYERVEQ